MDKIIEDHFRLSATHCQYEKVRLLKPRLCKKSPKVRISRKKKPILRLIVNKGKSHV